MSSECDALEWLQDWFQNHSNGDWEHGHGIKICTFDNPGWGFQVYLEGTELEGCAFEKISIDRAEDDWVRCKVETKIFDAACGPKNLIEAIRIFRAWAEPVAS